MAPLPEERITPLPCFVILPRVSSVFTTTTIALTLSKTWPGVKMVGILRALVIFGGAFSGSSNWTSSGFRIGARHGTGRSERKHTAEMSLTTDGTFTFNPFPVPISILGARRRLIALCLQPILPLSPSTPDPSYVPAEAENGPSDRGRCRRLTPLMNFPTNTATRIATSNHSADASRMLFMIPPGSYTDSALSCMGP